MKKDLKQLNDLYIKIGADLKADKKLKSKLQGRIQELQDSIAEIEIKTKVKKTKLSTKEDIALQEVPKKVNRTSVGGTEINFPKLHKSWKTQVSNPALF